MAFTLDKKLIHNKHIDDIHTIKSIFILKVFSSTKWSKETLLSTYKAVTRPTLEYATTT